MFCARLSTALFLLSFFACEKVAAQTVVVTPVEESFSAEVAVSGSIVVGAAIGNGLSKLDPREFLILVPDSEAGTPLCFSTKTRDGQYWSLAVTDLPGNVAGGIRIEPESGWQFLKELEVYNRSDYAAIARLGEGCESDLESPIIPIRYVPDNNDILSVAINSQRAIRVNAALEGTGTDLIAGKCKKANSGQGRSTAFNFLCSFNLRELEKNQYMTLSVERRLRIGGKRKDNVKILIPE